MNRRHQNIFNDGQSDRFDAEELVRVVSALSEIKKKIKEKKKKRKIN